MKTHHKDMSLNEVIQVLADHGWSLDSPTAVNIQTGDLIFGSSFTAEMGYKLVYSRKAVYRWLGY